MYTIVVITNNQSDFQAIEDSVNNGEFYIQQCEANIFIEKCSQIKPNILFCDYTIAENVGINFFSKIRSIVPQIIITITLNKCDKNLIFNAMKYGINNFIFSPLHAEDCCHLLKICSILLHSRKKTNVTNVITSNTSISYLLRNEIASIPKIIEVVLQKINPVFEIYKSDIQIGLEELLINAIEHGNLNISYHEKSQALENGTFEQLIEFQKNNSLYKDKKVTITFNQTPQYDEWIISDEGEGFDPCEIPSFTKKNEVNKLHGRGILITRFQFDEIAYSNEGRTVRVRRYVPKED